MKAGTRYLLSFALVFGLAAVASLFTYSQFSSWYTSLSLPNFTPPSSLFAPIWILLYACVAIALARMWGLAASANRLHWFFPFGIQLLLSVAWPVLLLGFHALLLAVADVLILWFAVVILTLHSWELDRACFWLLIPYLAWTTFALILTVAIWWIN